MNKLPEDFDSNILVGHILEMICFNANQIYFHFNDRIFITAETTFLYQKPPEYGGQNEIKVPAWDSDLMRLVEHRISMASVEDRHILTIEFDNGFMLRFSDTAPGVYELYKITIRNNTIIV